MGQEFFLLSSLSILPKTESEDSDAVFVGYLLSCFSSHRGYYAPHWKYSWNRLLKFLVYLGLPVFSFLLLMTLTRSEVKTTQNLWSEKDHFLPRFFHSS